MRKKCLNCQIKFYTRVGLSSCHEMGVWFESSMVRNIEKWFYGMLLQNQFVLWFVKDPPKFICVRIFLANTLFLCVHWYQPARQSANNWFIISLFSWCMQICSFLHIIVHSPLPRSVVISYLPSSLLAWFAGDVKLPM